MKNLFLLGALLIPTIVYSANDLERWNSEVGRTVRQAQSEKLAQTTYREISSKNVTVAQDMKTVYPQIETNAQVAGSRTRVVAEAVLDVDKEKVARDWNKKLSKFGKATNAVGAALTIGGLILDAVDWVMDPENNTIQKRNPAATDTDPSSPYNPTIYYNNQHPTLVATTPEGVCKLSGYTFVRDGSWLWCYAANGGRDQVQVKPNPAYNPSAPPQQPVVVSEAEIEQALKNILNDPKYADLAKQMIGNSYTIGSDNPDPDPNIVNDIKDAQKGTLKSDDPKGDGRTRTDPKIDTGTQGQADTTPKPDTGTGTNPDTGTGTTPTPNPSPNNGSTTNFELPAFCNYAAKLCDWLDWTQEDKELEEAEKEEPEELDLGTIDKNRFSANGQCPAPKEIDETVKALGRNVNFDFKIEWTPICSVAEDTSPLVLLISTITGLLILVGGGRSSEP